MAPLYVFLAFLCGGLAVAVLVLLRERKPLVPVLALALTAAWAGAAALSPGDALVGVPAALETLRSAAWLGLLLGLGRTMSGGVATALDRRFLLLGACLTVLSLTAQLARIVWGVEDVIAAWTEVLARVALALLVVVVAENLFRNADVPARWHVNLPCIVLGFLSAFDVLVYAQLSITRGVSDALLNARAAVTILTIPLLGIGVLRARRFRRQPAISREVAFHGATLLVAGTFLFVVGAAGEALQRSGTEWGEAAQITLAAAAIIALLVAFSSHSARSRLRWLVLDHFFAARFDYRREWLRTVRTLAEAEGAETESVRAIRAVADTVDSPGGVLLRREVRDGELRWAGSWNSPEVTLGLPASDPWLGGFRDGTWIQEAGRDAPSALRNAYGRLWLAVPLSHHRDGLIGCVLLAPPRAHFALDGEVFDLLRTVGREVALFLSERRAAERLVEQRRVEEYAKRFAFVAHDVKNVSNQLNLTLANAECNMQNPDFQRDMLFTLRRSAERIDTLIARLRIPEAAEATLPTAQAVAPLPRLRALARAQRHPVSVEVEGEAPGLAAMAPEPFEAAVTHLLDNAVEASAADEPVRIRVRRNKGLVVVDITDSGDGMSVDFIRDELFRPLSTSKPKGSGIGAWQARDLLQSAGGTVTVLSRPGAGTTMRLTLPSLPDEVPGKSAEERRA